LAAEETLAYTWCTVMNKLSRRAGSVSATDGDLLPRQKKRTTNG